MAGSSAISYCTPSLLEASAGADASAAACLSISCPASGPGSTCCEPFLTSCLRCSPAVSTMTAHRLSHLPFASWMLMFMVADVTRLCGKAVEQEKSNTQLPSNC